MKSYFYQIPETNCIPELLTDEQYAKIRPYLHNIKLRDYMIKRDFTRLVTAFKKREVFTILTNQYKMKRYTLRKKTHNDTRTSN